MKRLKALLPGLAILLLAVIAASVRLPALTAGLPYLSYVDEGHVLHHVSYLLGQRTWVPDTYSYPSLPFYVIAGVTLAYSPVYAAVHGRPLQQDLSPAPPRHYDVLEPTELLILGRLVTLAFSLGIVVLAGLLARRLAGPAAGLLAAWLAALVPALVARSVIVNINPIVAFFAVSALYFVEGARDGARPRRDAVLAGVMAGLTGATKYPAAVICLPVAAAILLASAPWRERLIRLVLTGASALAALLLAMPALLLRTREVIDGIVWMSRVYEAQEAGSYWDQVIRRAEWDLPLNHPELGIAFLLLAAAGLVVGLLDRRWRKSVWPWLIFIAATCLLVSPYKFRAFRNLLSLVPVGCVLVALLYAWIREKVRRPLLVDLAAAVLPAVLFAPALHQYVHDQLRLEDSREQAIHWLDENTVPRDRILFAEEMAFLPSRVASLEVADADIAPWNRARDRIFRRGFRYIVLGELSKRTGMSRIPYDVRVWILKNYKVVAHFGAYPTNAIARSFKGNGQIVYILRRVPRTEPRPASSPPPPPRGAARRSASP